MMNPRLPPATLNVSLKFAGSNEQVQAMIDTGSTGSFINASTAAKIWSESPFEAQGNRLGKWRLPGYVKHR